MDQPSTTNASPRKFKRLLAIACGFHHIALPHQRAVKGFSDGLAWVAEIGLFIMLGLLVDVARLPAAIGIALVAAVLLLAFKGLHFSIEFTGGTVIEVSYEQTANVDGIRTALKGQLSPDQVRSALMLPATCWRAS